MQNNNPNIHLNHQFTKFQNVHNMYIQYQQGLKPVDFKKNCVFKFLESTLLCPGSKNSQYLLQNNAFLMQNLRKWLTQSLSDGKVAWTNSDKISRMMMHRLCAFYGLEHNVDMVNADKIVIEYHATRFNNWAASVEEWAEYLSRVANMKQQQQDLDSSGVVGGSNGAGQINTQWQARIPHVQPMTPLSDVPGLPGYAWRWPPFYICAVVPTTIAIPNTNSSVATQQNLQNH